MTVRHLLTIMALSAATMALAADRLPLADKIYGRWGVDLEARDLSIRPGNDFDAHAGGSWAKRTIIPADEASAGPYEELRRLTQARMAAIIQDSPATAPVGGLYRSFIDERAVEARGASPLAPALSAIRAAPDRDALAVVTARAPMGFGMAVVRTSTGNDPDDATRVSIQVGQSGLGLPDRDHYLLDRFADLRTIYAAHGARSLALAGWPGPDAAATAAMAFETAVARVSYSRTDSLDVTKSMNPTTLAGIERDHPGLPWRAMLSASGFAVMPDTRIIVGEKGAIRAIAALWAATPIETLRAWAAVRTVDDASPFLSRAFVDSRFTVSRALVGVQQLRSRERRALQLVDRLMGDAIGRDYVARFFDPRAKPAMITLANNVRTAMKARIAGNPWLSPKSRATARAKLDRMMVMVGYPDTWRDYTGLRIDSADLFGNVARARAHGWAWERSLLGKPVDRRIWWMTPQTVNAYTNFQDLTLVFPAGRLQPPFFHVDADPAANYGAIGAIVGHEFSHNFDDAGRRFDVAGRARDWWTPADSAAFEARIAVLGAQYDALEVLPGLRINGTLTMGENIADVAGVQAALDAYHASLGGKLASVIDGLTGDQRFFLAYAQARREKQRDADLRDQVSSDEHAPSRFRVIGAVRNVDAWYAAFDVRAGDRYYLPPQKRARIW